MKKNREVFRKFTEFPLACEIKTNFQTIPKGEKVEVEGYWDEVTGKSWMFSDGNPACLVYAMRSAIVGLPTDNEVLYVKYEGYGSLVHHSEIEWSSHD